MQAKWIKLYLPKNNDDDVDEYYNYDWDYNDDDNQFICLSHKNIKKWKFLRDWAEIVD